MSGRSYKGNGGSKKHLGAAKPKKATATGSPKKSPLVNSKSPDLGMESAPSNAQVAEQVAQAGIDTPQSGMTAHLDHMIAEIGEIESAPTSGGGWGRMFSGQGQAGAQALKAADPAIDNGVTLGPPAREEADAALQRAPESATGGATSADQIASPTSGRVDEQTAEPMMVSADGVSIPQRHAMIERMAHYYAYEDNAPLDEEGGLALSESDEEWLATMGYTARVVVNESTMFRMVIFEPTGSGPFAEAGANSPVVAFRGTINDNRLKSLEEISRGVIEDLSEGEFPDPSVLMSLLADWIEHDADAEGLSETKYLENKSIIQRELRALNEQHGNVVLTGHSQGGTNALRAAADMPTFVKEVVTFQGAGTTADAAEQLDQHNVDVTAYTHSQDRVHHLGYHPENTNPIRLNRDDGGVIGAHTSMLLGETGDASRFGEGGVLEQEFNDSDVEQLDEHESKNSRVGQLERTARHLMWLGENIPTPDNMMDKLGDGYWEMQKELFRFYTTGEFENETETETIGEGPVEAAVRTARETINQDADEARVAAEAAAVLRALSD